MPAQYKTKSAYFIIKMEKLTALIYNTNCHKQYTKVSNYLGNRLDESLKDIFIKDYIINLLNNIYYDRNPSITYVC